MLHSVPQGVQLLRRDTRPRRLVTLCFAARDIVAMPSIITMLLRPPALWTALSIAGFLFPPLTPLLFVRGPSQTTKGPG